VNIRDLLHKRVVFVSGKGGVGKTTVAITLGLIAAGLGRKVLIVEMNATGRVPAVFGKTSQKQEIVPLTKQLSSIDLTAKECFEEFVLQQIKLKILYNTFFNNKYVMNFVEAVPGLSELLLLGKIYDLERSTKSFLSGQPLYDLIIVDAPATGHGLSMLEVPKVVASVVKVGPMYRSAINMQKLFDDGEKTAFCLVTLAEEMPVVESEEYVKGLKSNTGMHFGPLFVNAVMPDIQGLTGLSKIPEALVHYGDYHELTRKRAALNRTYLKEIEHAFSDFDRIVLPFVFRELAGAEDFTELKAAVGKV
jgi:anion-transporting  ArsA/GET3 family ATPase